MMVGIVFDVTGAIGSNTAIPSVLTELDCTEEGGDGLAGGSRMRMP